MNRRQLGQRKNVQGSARSGIDERDAETDGRVRIDHARSDHRAIGRPHGGLELLHRLMRRRRLEAGFRAGTREDHTALNLVIFLELYDVLLNLLNEIDEIAAAFVEGDILSSVETRVEEAGPGAYALELVCQAFYQIRVERAGQIRGPIHVGFDHIPRPEHETVQLFRSRQLEVVANARVVGLLGSAHVNHAQLGERADRLGDALFDRFDTCDERRADGTQTTQKNFKPLRVAERNGWKPGSDRRHGVVFGGCQLVNVLSAIS